jgi:hypothetical protein
VKEGPAVFKEEEQQLLRRKQENGRQIFFFSLGAGILQVLKKTVQKT